MKIFRVRKSYYDGDHDHGSYESPLFSDKKEAEKFRDKVWGNGVEENKQWWTETDWQYDGTPTIETIEILDECPEEVEKSELYLHVTWT